MPPYSMSTPSSPTPRGARSRASQKLHDLNHRVEEIGAEGEEGAVGEVRDVEHARDDRQTDAHERVEHARGQPVENLADEEWNLHTSSAGSAGATRFGGRFGRGVNPPSELIAPRYPCRRRTPPAAAWYPWQ